MSHIEHLRKYANWYARRGLRVFPCKPRDKVPATAHGRKDATTDPARIAAQVVSGISFLGAGVIFKHGNAVRGLTTAAGLWATAGIGLAMGAGMYPVGVFGTLMIALLQILMHKFVMQADALASNHLHFTVQDSAQFHERLGDYLQERNVQIMDSRITYHDDGFVSYDITVRAPREMTISDLNQFLRSCGDVRGISYTPIY